MADFSYLIGKIFKKGGGRSPGHWIVVSLTEGNYCACLSFDKDGNINGAATYQPHYVAGKQTVAKIDIAEIRIQGTRTDSNTGDGWTSSSGLPPIFPIESFSDGESDRSGQTLVP